jgi:ubiquinone/menaquinone biosynthesis C-methylase UbiE
LREENSSKIEYYDNLSSSYDKLYAEEQHAKHQEVRRYLANKRFCRILDVGCGTGSLIRILQSNADELIGLDVSLKMIQLAKQKSSLDKSSFVRAASPFLPFVNSAIDCVVSVSLLVQEEKLQDHQREFDRVSTREGTVVFTTFESDLGQGVQNKKSVMVGRRELLHIHSK